MPSQHARSDGSRPWSTPVLQDSERLNTEINSLNQRASALEVAVAKLPVKASIWCGVTGLVTTLIALVLQYLKASGG